MEPKMLYDDLLARGFGLTVVGEKVRVEPASRLTDADRVAIRQYKPALVRILDDLARALDEDRRGSVGVLGSSTRVPDTARGPVFVADDLFRVTLQSPGRDLPDWCYAWCQENDPQWWYPRGATAQIPEAARKTTVSRRLPVPLASEPVELSTLP